MQQPSSVPATTTVAPTPNNNNNNIPTDNSNNIVKPNNVSNNVQQNSNKTIYFNSCKGEIFSLQKNYKILAKRLKQQGYNVEEFAFSNISFF